jgi:excinuclease ABC subunit A
VVEVLGEEGKLYSLHSSCPVCGFSFPEIEPRLFSFNNPKGACPTCNGIGTLDLSDVEALEEEGLIETEDEDGDEEIDEYALRTCPDCHGTRLRAEALNVVLDGRNISEVASVPALELEGQLQKLKLSSKQQLVGEKILSQIVDRLRYLNRVGTGYLSLDRPTRTLSGGEAQRIRLASQVGSSLIGVLYVLDEPSIGLHPRDHHRLLEILQEIRDRGNTILMVEHDEDTIRTADHLIDLGPRAGRLGGELMAHGTPQELEKNPSSLTGQYLSGKKKIELPQERRLGTGSFLELKGASGNNLNNVDLKIPLGTLTGVSGVSGSGKSTLVIDTLFRILSKEFYSSHKEPAPYKKLLGLEHLDKVIDINQKPIGRTPRSVPATYVGVFPMIRELFAQLPESKIRGYKPGHFSFNVKGGRCETCQGAGLRRVEMHFLSDVYVKCETCQGRRYNREVLHIRFRGKNIADILEMTTAEAEEFFRNHSTIHRKLETLVRVGLDYITLGQSSTTLSGGEAQRVKLSKELSRRGTGKTLYILDEPTTGLHFEDVKKLIDLLQALVDQGNTVLVIEHNLDVLKCCDHIVDLGPEGGRGGGELVVSGKPEDVAREKRSMTGKFLSSLLR